MQQDYRKITKEKTSQNKYLGLRVDCLKFIIKDKMI